MLVDAAPKILAEIPRRLGEYAARQLAERGVEIRAATTLASLDAEAAQLSDGETIPTDTLVWTAGVQCEPAGGEARAAGGRQGPRPVDETLRVEGRDAIWALGDCARVPEPRHARSARPADLPARPPPGAPARAEPRRASVKPYRYRMLGQVATLGHYKGIADVLGLRLTGFLGWFVTRTLPPVPAAAAEPEAAGRGRLDRRALLPPGHRGARRPGPAAGAGR